MTTATQQSFAEAKSRHITPAVSVFDFQKGDGLLIKSGDSVVRKLVTELNPDTGEVTATDPGGGGAVTVKLDPNNPAKDGSEFKYWIDESGDTMSQQTVSEVYDDDFEADDLDDLDDLGDEIAAMDLDGDEMDDFDEDLNSFLGETSAVTSQVPDNTVGGGVDDNEHSDEDGEDPENTPAPHDTTGIQNPGDVQTMAGSGSSNVGGSSPSDQVQTNNSVGGPAQATNPVVPMKGEHEPGTPDTHESIVRDVNTAISLVRRGASPEQLAPRLLAGER